MKFRKKPVVIDAERIPQDVDGRRDFGAWGKMFLWLQGADFHITEDLGINIKTLEGVMYGGPGDWIIRGVKGEFYPCKPDIFSMTYEPV